MNVDFLCRFLKPMKKEVLDEIEQYLKSQKIIYGDDFDISSEREKLMLNRSSNEKYEYSALSFDLKDVKIFNAADDKHVSVRFYGGESFVIKCDYETFRGIFQFCTGRIIHDFTVPNNIKLMIQDGEQSISNKDDEEG